MQCTKNEHKSYCWARPNKKNRNVFGNQNLVTGEEQEMVSGKFSFIKDSSGSGCRGI